MFIVSFPECYTFELNTFATKNSIVKLQHATALAGSVSVIPGDTSAPMWSSQIKKKIHLHKREVKETFQERSISTGLHEVFSISPGVAGETKTSSLSAFDDATSR